MPIPAELQNLVDSVAQAIVSRGFGIPAIFVLEMYKPLQTIFHSGTILSAPILLALTGKSIYRDALLLLEDRQNVESLIVRIEELQNKKKVTV